MFEKWGGIGWTAVLSRRGELAHFIYAGTANARTFAEMRDAAAERIGPDTLVMLVDLTACDIVASSSAGVRRAGIDRPGAYIIKPSDLHTVTDMCWRIALCGVVRAPFTDYASAYAWAKRRVRLERAALAQKVGARIDSGWLLSGPSSARVPLDR